MDGHNVILCPSWQNSLTILSRIRAAQPQRQQAADAGDVAHAYRPPPYTIHHISYTIYPLCINIYINISVPRRSPPLSNTTTIITVLGEDIVFNTNPCLRPRRTHWVQHEPFPTTAGKTLGSTQTLPCDRGEHIGFNTNPSLRPEGRHWVQHKPFPTTGGKTLGSTQTIPDDRREHIGFNTKPCRRRRGRAKYLTEILTTTEFIPLSQP